MWYLFIFKENIISVYNHKTAIIFINGKNGKVIE